MELWLTAGASFAALIFCAWRGSARLFVRLKCLFRSIASSPLKAGLFLIAIAVLVYPLPSLLWRVPGPVTHDEFGYLLQGDTFAHGRLANPSHPMREFFETFHILQSPTYAAKFPPGLGMTLAVGFWLGLPLIGNWLMLAAASCAILWMLRAAMPLRWAALIAALTALHPTVLWFSQIYWGGAIALAGGALLGAAVLRGMKRPTVGLGLIAGAGISLLMVGRPFEGALVSIACGVAMLALAIRDQNLRPLILRFAPASVAVVVIAGCGLMFYNSRVTGHPTLLPYVLHTRNYMAAPLFYWQPIPPTPNYPNDQIRKFYTTTEYEEYGRHLHWPGFLTGVFDRAGMVLWAYIRSLLLIIPLLVAILWTRGRVVFTSLAICVLVLSIHVTVSPWMRPAYMAPLMGLLLVPIGLGLRRLYVWRVDNQPLGRAMVRAIVITQLVIGGFELVRNARFNANVTIAQRQRVIHDLQQQGGKHLVLVQYTADVTHEQEWVYNGADIDASPIIFARDLGEEADQRLLAYYPDRKTWVVKVSRHDSTLKSLDPADGSSITPDSRSVVSTVHAE